MSVYPHKNSSFICSKRCFYKEQTQNATGFTILLCFMLICCKNPNKDKFGFSYEASDLKKIKKYEYFSYPFFLRTHPLVLLICASQTGLVFGLERRCFGTTWPSRVAEREFQWMRAAVDGGRGALFVCLCWELYPDAWGRSEEFVQTGWSERPSHPAWKEGKTKHWSYDQNTQSISIIRHLHVF